MTVDECFAPWPPVYRDIYDALTDFMSTLGTVHADVVKVGVFLKRQRKIAEIRPKARSLSLDLILPRRVDDPRISRTIPISADRIAHMVKLTKLEDLDDQLLDWLTEAYAAG
jgi:hypothetical protein